MITATSRRGGGGGGGHVWRERNKALDSDSNEVSISCKSSLGILMYIVVF